MRILVTGATGFIGNHVIENLLANYGEHEIVATGRNIDKIGAKTWANKITFIPADLHNGEDLFSALCKPDVLIHLAWGGLPNYHSLHHINDNLPNDFLFLRNMIESGVKRIFVAGTCYEYGMAEGEMSIDTDPVEPITNYAFAKRTLHSLLKRNLSGNTKTKLCWGRIFFMYGEGQAPTSFIPLLEKAINNKDDSFKMSMGEQLRDYLSVEDIAAKICHISLNDKFEGTYNICSGTPISIRRLAEKFIQKHNSNIKLELGYYPYPDYEPLAFWGFNNLEG